MWYNWEKVVTNFNIKFFRAVGVMVGGMVGVGIFGLPYVFSKAGFTLGLMEVLIIGSLMLFLQLMLAEVVLQTRGRHRLVGYVKIYLGNFWSKVTIVAISAGVWGAMVAYIIVGGKFAHILLNPVFGGGEMIYSLLIASIASFFIYRGLEFAAKAEIIIVIGLLLLFLFLILVSIPHIDMSNYATINFSNAFLPYGVVLFSLAGIGVVPELKDVLGVKQENKIGHVIMMGMFLIVSLYILFSAAVVGVTGADTTQAAFEGLVPILGDSVRVLATFLGSLTILSIYTILGIELLNTFRFDYNLKQNHAWFAVVSVPVVLFLLGLRELIDIIGFVGAVFGGVLGILIALTYWSLKKSPVCKKHKCLNFPNILTWLLIMLFTGGIILEITSTLIK